MNSNEVLDLLEWSGAIMKGHFELTSGRHSDTYIEKFRLLEKLEVSKMSNPIGLNGIKFVIVFDVKVESMLF